MNDDHFYWYNGSVVSLEEDINHFIWNNYSYEQVRNYLQEKKFADQDNFPTAIVMDEEYSVSKGQPEGAVYLGSFDSSYRVVYFIIIFLSYVSLITIINVLIKKIEDSFKYVSQTAEDLNVISEHYIEEKRLLGYVQSFFDPIEQVSKSFLPKYKQDAFKDNHKKSVKGFTDLINNYIEARKQELLIQLKVRNETRNKIATDLHDDIGATLTKISHNSDIIKSSKDLFKIKQASDKIGLLSREMLLSFNDVIWAIDSGKDTMTDLIDHMYDLSYDLLPEKNIKVNFTADRFGTKEINVEIRQNVYLIFKEALNNICKYACAKEVIIVIKKEKNSFSVDIKDNGHGYESTTRQKGNGLHNMHKRAEKIKADLKIENNNGVSVHLDVNL